MFVDLTNIQEKEFYIEFGFEYSKGSVIESLLINCSLPNVISSLIWDRLHARAFTDFEADEVIKYLESNQLNRMKSGFNYNQEDISEELCKIYYNL